MPDKGFFGALFDLSFASFVTTKIIKVLYVIGIVVGGITALAYVIVAFTASPVLGLVTLVIFAPIAFLLYVIYTRVFLELVMVSSGSWRPTRSWSRSSAGRTAVRRRRLLRIRRRRNRRRHTPRRRRTRRRPGRHAR